MSPTIEERSTAHGFWRFAANYLLAAREVQRKLDKNGRLFFPTLHLYSMAVELSLKAFLLKRGASLGKLKSLSHNLDDILKYSRRRKLGRIVKLNRFDISAIRAANITYSTHTTRYMQSGTTAVPNVTHLLQAAERLVDGLELYCTGQRGRI